MTEVVIDTNVLLVAEGKHPDVSQECIAACVQRLGLAMKTATVVIDDNYRVLREYQNKLSAAHGKRAGTVFLKWLMQNQANPKHVACVSLTERAKDCFAEFPNAQLEVAFDPPDRKFPAIANAHTAKPPILQAVDSKWLRWWSQLEASGIRVEFLCPNDICKFFSNKFPGERVPALP
jgi:hypothetical protein